MRPLLTRALALLCLSVSSFAAQADTSLLQQVQELEPTLGAFPPNLADEAALGPIKQRYEALKATLDLELASHPRDVSLRYARGYLQSLGHNMDYPGAWEGATADLTTLLKANPSNGPAALALGTLWVNSKPELAQPAEYLFRAAQCAQGKRPLEEAQRGLYFAFYYQGNMQAAYRQSAYLVSAWPQNEGYRKLHAIARSVLSRDGKTPPALPEKLKMVSCKKRAN